MDNLYADQFWFFVPSRLVWTNWVKLMGEQENPGDSTDYITPSLVTEADTVDFGSIFDYMGIRPKIAGLDVGTLPFRCYNLIWNEFMRDENLQDSAPVPKGDTDDWSNYKLLKRGKRHDYFTSCLPWTAKNGVSVDLPLGDVAPVHLEQASFGYLPFLDKPWKFDNTKSPSSPYSDYSNPRPNFWSSNANEFAKTDGAYVDLSSATGATINSLRQAFQVQRYFEAAARGGCSRYTEVNRQFFGVVSPDARLQRPEFLGGSSAPINISTVPQTSASDETTPQGNLAAFGVLSANRPGFTKSFVEHGFIIGLINIRADLNYQQGLHKMWSRRTKFDYYWPTFSHLGEDAVKLRELYAQGTEADDTVFGYQERYAELRYAPNMITGVLRSDHPQSLDVWHLAEKFENAPALNAEFIESNTPLDRVIAVPSEPHFILDARFHVEAIRPLPLYGVPGLIDHF